MKYYIHSITTSDKNNIHLFQKSIAVTKVHFHNQIIEQMKNISEGEEIEDEILLQLFTKLNKGYLIQIGDIGFQIKNKLSKNRKS